jgi:hypothetical protein
MRIPTHISTLSEGKSACVGEELRAGEDALPGHVVGGGCLALLKDYLELFLLLVLVCISTQISRCCELGSFFINPLFKKDFTTW